MNVCVLGLWHLGSVTAGCVASLGHSVVGFDPDDAVVDGLCTGKPPIGEPGLPELIRHQMALGRLRFTSDLADALSEAQVVWLTHDTPVDDQDNADTAQVMAAAVRTFPYLREGALVLISSQLPVGSTRELERLWARTASGRDVSFAYAPENLRLGQAIDVFLSPDRIVVGTRIVGDERIKELFGPLADTILWMGTESAEMTKHALNAFLATSVTFINEIAVLCEQVGADANEVERGLKSEARIGPKAYLSPGGAFAGGTLARDVVFLSLLGQTRRVATHLLSAITPSNSAHRQWAQRRLDTLLDGVAGKTVAIWGLTYKSGTDTLRRSSSIELCHWLLDQGATVRAHDPAVKALPPDLVLRVELANSALSAVVGASALVIATAWSEYRQVAADAVVPRMARPLILDANRFTSATLGNDPRIEFMSVGKPGATP